MGQRVPLGELRAEKGGEREDRHEGGRIRFGVVGRAVRRPFPLTVDTIRVRVRLVFPNDDKEPLLETGDVGPYKHPFPVPHVTRNGNPRPERPSFLKEHLVNGTSPT